jgi:RNA recognition motif-containing protein
MSMKLYVGNLSQDISDSQLREIFLPFGDVESAKIITDRYTGGPRGFGFVEMSTRENGERAINELNGKMIGDRKIIVNEARPRPPGGGSGGYRPRGGNRGRF